jgi:2-hydroxy-3-oxopropionate reductase
MRRIGIIGVGLLGSAVATRLLQRGFEVIGYDTRATQVEALHPQGWRAAASVAGAAAEADAVFTMLPTLDSVEAVVCGPGGWWRRPRARRSSSR